MAEKYLLNKPAEEWASKFDNANGTGTGGANNGGGSGEGAPSQPTA